MSMKYLKLVKSEKLTVAASSATAIDTHGLMAKLIVNSGTAYIAGEEDTAGTSSGSFSTGQDISFVGSVKLLGKGAYAEISVLYFDKI